VNLVTGRLGAGSTTLLLAAAGLAPLVTGGARSGAVKTLGLDPGTPAGRSVLAGRVGLLLATPWTQLSGMAMTVREEVAFGPANHGWERQRIFDAVSSALDRMAVTHLADRDPGSLSGGELQKVMIAALLAMEPDVLLLDEPALELDTLSTTALYDLLAELARTRTVVVASIDVDRLAAIASRVVLLDGGRCLGDGGPADLLGSTRAVEMRVSSTIAEIASGAGLPAPYPVTLDAALRTLRK
jgi:energy-coupling factor transporter ATP-binding protein EcfA2